LKKQYENFNTENSKAKPEVFDFMAQAAELLAETADGESPRRPPNPDDPIDATAEPSRPVDDEDVVVPPEANGIAAGGKRKRPFGRTRRVLGAVVAMTVLGGGAYFGMGLFNQPEDPNYGKIKTLGRGGQSVDSEALDRPQTTPDVLQSSATEIAPAKRNASTIPAFNPETATTQQLEQAQAVRNDDTINALRYFGSFGEPKKYHWQYPRVELFVADFNLFRGAAANSQWWSQFGVQGPKYRSTDEARQAWDTLRKAYNAMTEEERKAFFNTEEDCQMLGTKYYSKEAPLR
jgi:hypothetical protein